MKKGFVLAAAAALSVLFLFPGCFNPSDPKNSEYSEYSVKIEVDKNKGEVTTTPSQGPAGTEVKLYVNPKAGFKYRTGSLTFKNDTGLPPINDGGSQPYTFNLTKDVTITAEFDVLPVDTFSVTIGALSGGTITASPSSGKAGDTITLTVTPDKGYGLKAGTLAYTPKGGSSQEITGNSFTMPASHITVTAEFEKQDDAEQLEQDDAKQLEQDGTKQPEQDSAKQLEIGITALKEGNYDAAIMAFESAWKQKKDDPKAIVYSSLGKLASIATDANVRTLMRDRLGLTGYPGTIGKLITTDWMEQAVDQSIKWSYFDGNNWLTWYDENENLGFFNSNQLTPKTGYYRYIWNGQQMPVQYEFVTAQPQYDSSTSFFPGMSVPAWFERTGSYQNSLTGGNLKSSSTYSLLMFASLLDKNPNGLNQLLDELLSAAFGSVFEEAVTRAGALKDTDFVEVDEDILKAFGISEIFEGDKIYLGKPELNILFSAVRIVRASVEWVAAYDWNTDLTFLRFDWNRIADMEKPASLPLRNNFLMDRKNGMMDKSKADYIKAIDDAIAAYNFMIGDSGKIPQGARDILNEYKWLRDGFTKLKMAINGGTMFYVKDASGSANYSNTAGDALFGIHLGNFFTPGYFGLDKIITTTGSGNSKMPKFFGSDGGTEITDKTHIDGYGSIGFEIKMGPFKETFPVLFDNMQNTEKAGLFSPEIGKKVWDFYH